MNPNVQGFFRDDPFGPDPWPYLLQFVEGRATIRDLGILVPIPPAGSRPTTGWTLSDGYGTIFELRGALLLTGRDPLDFAVSGVRVTAEPDPSSDVETTAFHGIEFGGLLFDQTAPEPFPVFPARGSFELTDSVVLGVLNGAPLGELAQANVRVARNRFRSAVAVELIDADRSQVAIVQNRWDVSYRGVQVFQNLDGAPSRASGILVDANRGSLAPFFPGIGDGISFQDPIDASPDPGGSVLWATRNRLVLGNAAGPAASGITARGSARPRLADNRLSGAAGTGIEVDVTSRCRVQGNSFRGLETGAGPDLHLGSGHERLRRRRRATRSRAGRGREQPGDPAVARPLARPLALDGAGAAPYTLAIMFGMPASTTARKRATRKRTSRHVGGVGGLHPRT